VATYAALLAAELPALITHTWWSADSGAAGVIAELYRHPPAGQYIVLGNHGWFETLSFDLLTRGLPAHRLLWYVVPVAVWVATLALIGVAAARAFGRYGAALAVAGLLCLAPTGLMLVFQPTAHTGVVFHAAVLVAVAAWVLPKIRTLPLPLTLGVGVLVGAFTGLAIAGDLIALVWAVLPFVVAVGVCAMRGPVAAAARAMGFGLAALTGMLISSSLLTAIMHSAGFRVDELAQSELMRFVHPDALGANAAMMLNELAYPVGGDFFGQRIDSAGYIELLSGGMLLLAGAAGVLAVYRSAVAAGQRRIGGNADEVSPRLVYVAFWSTCLGVGLLMFVLSLQQSGGSRYLLGPVVAIAALLPVVAARGRDWRMAVGAGLTVMALAGFVRLDTRPLPYLPTNVPLAQRDMTALTRFAHRYHVTSGYASYWDAVTITWHTRFAVNLHPAIHCGREMYCPLYHADSFTAAYTPRRGLRTLWVADARDHSAPLKSWGRPLAVERVGRLMLYAYRYDVANQFRQPRPGQIQRIITGRTPPGWLRHPGGPYGRASWTTF
jgi:hypothetical protein